MFMGNLKRIVISSVIIILLGSCISSANAENHDFDFFTLFENHGAVMLIIEVESGAIVRANEAAAAFYGYPKDVLESMTIQQINMLEPEEVERERRAAAAEKRNYFIFPHRLADGTTRTVEVYSYPFQMGDVTMLYSVIHDVTQREENELLLQQKLARLERAEQIARMGYWELNLKTGMFTFSEEAKTILGFKEYALSSVRIKQIILPEYHLMRDEALEGLILRNEPYDIQFRIRRPDDGRILYVHSIAEYNKEKNTIFGTFHDVTEQNEQAAIINRQRDINIYSMLVFIAFLLIFIGYLSLNIRRRKTAEQRLRITITSVGDGIIATDRQGRIELINPVAQNLTGWMEKEAVGKAFKDVFNIVNEYTRELAEDPVEKVLNTGRVVGLANHTLLISKDGREIAIADSAAPICDNSENIHGVVLAFRDVTEEQANLRKIEYLSFHDQLTGLYNRHFFETELNRLDTPRNLPMSMVIADVNGLKLVNDAFGHKAGDALLKKAAEVIKSQCRGDEIISRIGGDEFVILLPKTNLYETERIVKRIQEKTKEIQVDTVMLSISMGWACKDMPDIEFSEVFKQAEKFMYHRKLFDSQSMRGATVHSIMHTLHEKDKREEEHSRRVSELNAKVGQAMGLREESIEELRNVGMLHDIGKIAIPENILNKQGDLSSEERNEMKRHPEIGYHILSSVIGLADIAEYVLAHHERWDGNGYPKGLRQNEIPLQARITAVGNVYDAIVTDRPYQKALPKQQALEELKRNAGTQLDPEIVKIFVEKVAPQEEV
jgi:diguanylate cyclase (GGDEF)-like protein/PAS domain S-box-containing protein